MNTKLNKNKHNIKKGEVGRTFFFIHAKNDNKKLVCAKNCQGQCSKTQEHEP